MSNPFVNQAVTVVHNGENDVVSGLNSAAQTVGQAGAQVAPVGAQVGAVAEDGIQVVAGHTSIPLHFSNGTNRPIWVAVHADFSEPSSAFQSASTKAWFEIQPGQSINVGNIYTGIFYYCANNDRGEVWSGPTSFGDFVDGGGHTNSSKTFIAKSLQNNWLTFSSYTLTFVN